MTLMMLAITAPIVYLLHRVIRRWPFGVILVRTPGMSSERPNALRDTTVSRDIVEHSDTSPRRARLRNQRVCGAFTPALAGVATGR
jgi:hypothetical protein